jgi:serine protease AprX
MKPIGKLLLAVFLLFSITINAQTKNAFFVKFSGKNTEFNKAKLLSDKAIERRQKFALDFDSTDYPVNEKYIQQVLLDTSLTLRYSLKWHNAIVVETYSKTIKTAEMLPFVKGISFVGTTNAATNPIQPSFTTPSLKLKESVITTKNLTPENYGVAYLQNEQIGVIKLHQNGFDGNGVDLAVFDAGFLNIHKIPAFIKHQGNDMLTYGYDLVDLDLELNDRDNHGTAVSSCIGSYDVNNYIGSAPRANLFLFRTENASSEYPLEELNWCKAAELADSAGIDMITSSLGYNQYDDVSLSYTWADLTGRKSYISLAARLAVEKGIFVLNSAGNEGDKKWQKIGTPADVAEVLTIGAVDLKDNLGSFSSQGRNALGEIKPDVCALGVKANVASTYGSYYQGYGTSYATPIAAGGVACLLQAFPNVLPKKIADVVRHTASQCNTPDSLMGYGVARFDLAYDVLKQQETNNKQAYLMRVEHDRLVIYTGTNSMVTYSIFGDSKFLWIFTRKTKVLQGQLQTNGPIAIINLGQKDLKCNKKHTLNIEINNGVENQALKYSDLSLCAD